MILICACFHVSLGLSFYYVLVFCVYHLKRMGSLQKLVLHDATYS